jgi:hypothetical protein
MKRLIRATTVCLFSLLPLAAQSHEPGAHVHGVATLQVAVDADTLTLNLSSPLDNLIGFEHAARNEKEKTAVHAMTDALQKANLLFIPSPAAQCVLQSVNLDSMVIDKKTQKPSTPAVKSHDHDEEAGHADLDGEFVFKCGRTDKLRDLQVNLFQRFQHMRQIKVEVASSRGQTAATLTADKSSVSW